MLKQTMLDGIALNEKSRELILLSFLVSTWKEILVLLPWGSS
jgi:hypothetical protein